MGQHYNGEDFSITTALLENVMGVISKWDMQMAINKMLEMLNRCLQFSLRNCFNTKYFNVNGKLPKFCPIFDNETNKQAY